MRRECKPQKADRAVRDGVRSAGIREQTAGVTANIEFLLCELLDILRNASLCLST